MHYLLYPRLLWQIFIFDIKYLFKGFDCFDNQMHHSLQPIKRMFILCLIRKVTLEIKNISYLYHLQNCFNTLINQWPPHTLNIFLIMIFYVLPAAISSNTILEFPVQGTATKMAGEAPATDFSLKVPNTNIQSGKYKQYEFNIKE